MYKLYIPIANKTYSDQEKKSLIRELKKSNPEMVFLIFNRVLCNDSFLSELTQLFIENKKFLNENGFKVGAWFAPTIGYGNIHWGDHDAEEKFTLIKSIDGVYSKGAFCPLDDNFADEFLKLMTTIANTGVKDILFEDDFTLTGGKMLLLGCSCDKHMEKYCQMIGENITSHELYGKIFDGGKNKYRDAWCSLMSETLCEFTKKIEKTVHSIDKDIRMGFSANASSFTLEGVDLPTLSRILAGDTKPFMRMTGAPYWKNATILSANIEAVRVQAHWCGDDIELLTEGDTYPRPRHWVPSSYLECFDMILRADGKSQGILKYMIDYNFSADYEIGYVDNHLRNQKHYEEIERRFSGKEAVGLNVFEKMLLFQDEEFEVDIDIHDYQGKGLLPHISQWFLCDNSIPTAYGSKNCASIVFGANAHYVDDEMLKNGVIIDAQAAKILISKGIDVGIKSYEKAPTPALEHYIPDDEFAPIRLSSSGAFYSFELNKYAELLSEFIVTGGGGFSNISPHNKNGQKYPACFYYENAKGQKFMVYSFVPKTVTATSEWAPGIFRNYCRQKQIAYGIERLQNRKLPAMCYKNPELYILCKKDENSMAVGMWNLFADTVYNPEIILDDEYKNVDFYNCSGRLYKNKLVLDTDIIPYGFALFTLYK